MALNPNTFAQQVSSTSSATSSQPTTGPTPTCTNSTAHSCGQPGQSKIHYRMRWPTALRSWMATLPASGPLLVPDEAGANLAMGRSWVCVRRAMSVPTAANELG
jgi:hypothetical protein